MIPPNHFSMACVDNLDEPINDPKKPPMITAAIRGRNDDRLKIWYWNRAISPDREFTK
jgi:hypothetical protein